MESTNIVLLVIIVGILYMMTIKSPPIKIKNTTKKLKKNKFNATTNKVYKNPNDNSKLEILGEYDSVQSVLAEADKPNYAKLQVESVNPSFNNIQFHTDYRDVITAFNNIVPDKKQLFNIQNIPLTYSEPPASEVSNLIADFILVVNHNIQQVVTNSTNKNSGWDELVPDPNIESGWDKAQASLGLPKSLYDDPARKAPVKLIKITNVQKYETEDEIKYSCTIILQKVNVSDQVIVNVDFVQDKRQLTDENNFFSDKPVEMDVSIEKIFIPGYLTNGDSCGLGSSCGDSLNISGSSGYNLDNIDNYDANKDQSYDFNNLEYNNMTDPKYVQQVLMKKYKARNQEMAERTAMLDTEGRDFHSTLPDISKFDNIAGTRSIFDDMNSPKVFY